jgi:hypothetical protein
LQPTSLCPNPYWQKSVCLAQKKRTLARLCTAIADGSFDPLSLAAADDAGARPYAKTRFSIKTWASMVIIQAKSLADLVVDQVDPHLLWAGLGCGGATRSQLSQAVGEHRFLFGDEGF